MTGSYATTKFIERVCPICNRRYQTPQEKPAPTCGDPFCIRKARARGLPITAQPPLPTQKPKKPKKPKKGKSTKTQ